MCFLLCTARWAGACRSLAVHLPSVCPSVRLSVRPSASLPDCLPVSLSACLSVGLIVCLLVCFLFCLSACLLVWHRRNTPGKPRESPGRAPVDPRRIPGGQREDPREKIAQPPAAPSSIGTGTCAGACSWWLGASGGWWLVWWLDESGGWRLLVVVKCLG